MTRILEVDYKQRAYDGKWQILGKIADQENAYSYFTEEKKKITLVPNKWVTLGVYDYELEIV